MRPPLLPNGASDMRAQPHAYRRLPGSMTAIAVCSIMMATLGLLGGALSLLQTVPFALSSQQSWGSTSIVYVSANTTGAAQVSTMPASLPALPIYSTGTLIVSGISGVLHVALAVYLLSIGIMVLRESRRGRGLHLTYIPLKLLLIPIGTLATWWWARDTMGGLIEDQGTWTSLFYLLIKAFVLNIPVFVFLVALVVVFNRPAVREYYRSLDAVATQRNPR